MDIGKAIKELRKVKHITQKELAIRCGITPNALCNIEKGISFPSQSNIQKICDAMCIPPSYLLLFSITEEDVPEEKRFFFHQLCEPLKDGLVRGLNKNDNDKEKQERSHQ